MSTSMETLMLHTTPKPRLDQSYWQVRLRAHPQWGRIWLDVERELWHTKASPAAPAERPA